MNALAGTLPPVPTFLHETGEADTDAVAGLVTHLATRGTDGVVVLGTAGEGVALDDVARSAVIAAARAADAHGCIVAGCHGQTSREAVRRVELAAAAGADVALVLPPFYYAVGGDPLRNFFVDVADAAPIPLMLYHIPERTRNSLNVGQVAELAAHPNIVGIKDSGGDAREHAALLAVQSGSFAVFQGVPPLLLQSLVLGCAGAILPVSAIAPQYELALRRAVDEADLEVARDQMRHVLHVVALLRHPRYPMVTNLKAIAHALGWGGVTALAQPTADPAHVEWIAGEVERLGLRGR